MKDFEADELEEWTRRDERVRIRQKLGADLATWTKGAAPNSLRAEVARSLGAVLDRICEEAAPAPADLRPLLERCIALIEATGWRIQYQERVQVLLADLRRYLGLEEG